MIATSCTIQGRSRDQGANAPKSVVCDDEVRRRERQKGQHLHHQRRDEVIEQVLAPFVAEHRLLLVAREHALDRDEQRAGEQHVEHEEVEAEEDAVELIVLMRPAGCRSWWRAASATIAALPSVLSLRSIRLSAASMKPEMSTK